MKIQIYRLVVPVNHVARLFLVLLAATILTHLECRAATGEPSVEFTSNVPPTGQSPTNAKLGVASRVGWLSSFEFGMSMAVLAFGTLVMLAELLVIKFGHYDAEQSTRLVTVTLILVSTLFIITAGFSSEQIAPAMGLFGTIAGYLLGKQNAHNEKKTSSENN